MHEVSSRFAPDADSLLASMTLDEKIGQLFFARATGYFENEQDEDFRRLRHLIKEEHIGGIIFFRGHVYGQAMMTNKLQAMSKIPLWITQDMEYGAAMRISEATGFTPAMGVAATGNPDYAYRVGQYTAREARALGVQQIFAPVLDVNNNPRNPVINVRSYSGNPKTVATYGKAFIDGVRSMGLVSTAKHFPGHGDTDTDSHLALPVVNNNYARLDTLELVPFRAAIADSIPSIMSAHIALPKVSPNPDRPSTLDPNILQAILRDSLDYQGVVVTDALDMKGISSKYSPGRAVVAALKAGADIMLLSPDEYTAIYEVEAAVKSGRISEQRIDRSVRKILRWKISHGLFHRTQVNLDRLSKIINAPDAVTFSDYLARRSITVLKNKDDVLPLRPKDYPKVLTISISDDEDGNTGLGFVHDMRKYHPMVSFDVFDKRTSKEEQKDILQAARKTDLIVLASYIYVQTGKDIQLSDRQLSFIHKLKKLGKPIVLIAFGNPYVIHDLPEADVHMLAWSAARQQVDAAADALFGASRIAGRLPIRIPGLYRMGDGLEMPQTTIRLGKPESVRLNPDSLYKIDRIMRNAIQDSTFPGGVVGILKNGVLAYNKGFGYQTYDKLKKVEEDGIYDLASLTKIVATTTAIMKLVDEGKVHLNDRVGKYFPEYRHGNKRKVRVRNLLLHNAGLPPFRIYVDSLKKRNDIVQAVKDEPLVEKPGDKFIYSDLGFILLGEIVQKVTGKRLDQYVEKEFFYPMGMSDTHFNPKRFGYWINGRVAPSEIDTVYRHTVLRGEVDDERAWYMDGVAGHAGLFSSTRDLAIFAQMLLNGGSYGGVQFISPQTVKEFTAIQSEASRRGYGFDHKSEGFSTAGSLASMQTFGHLGFTGTSLWIDPTRNMAVILLTNRTWPHRSYGKHINQVRAGVSDAAISSIEE